VQEAYQRLGISKARTYQLIEMRRLPSVQTPDGRIWVPEEAIEARVAGKQRLGSSQCVSTTEVADFHGVDTKTVREWHAEGLLNASRIRNRLCFSPQDVVTFVPPTYNGPGRLPKRRPTRTLRGRVYPTPESQQQ
jgi:predicted site-specific integrase-resolvase